MYIDGHEQDDVVEYRHVFISCRKQYKHCFHKWDYEGNELLWPDGFPIPDPCFRLIPIMHNKLTFYQNDQRNTAWTHSSDKPTPRPKGNGQSIMVSDFLTSEWGRLRDDDE